MRHGTTLYFDDHGSYQGATADEVRRIDAGLGPTVSTTSYGASYSIESVVAGAAASLRGPGGLPPPEAVSAN